jgi:ribosomal protein S27E
MVEGGSKLGGKYFEEPKPEGIIEIDCPDCGETVEFMSDEKSRKCDCGRTIERPR